MLLQYLVNNRQLYKLERSSAIARCILPGSVDLDVNTYLTVSQQVSSLPCITCDISLCQDFKRQLTVAQSTGRKVWAPCVSEVLMHRHV